MSQQYAFVGCYTGYAPGQLGWVGSKQPGEGILSFSFDNATGSLAPTGELTRQDSPTWLEINPNGRFLVAVHELSHHTGVPAGVGFVTSYRIQPDGALDKYDLRPDDLEGGTFSISSLGGIGGTFFTPIVNHPEVAVLGVSRMEWKPIRREGEFVPRLILPLSLSYDHRVIDGADAVRFTGRLAAFLSDLRLLLM